MDLVERAGMCPYEKVLVADEESSSRFETYIIPGESPSKSFNSMEL